MKGSREVQRGCRGVVLGGGGGGGGGGDDFLFYRYRRVVGKMSGKVRVAVGRRGDVVVVPPKSPRRGAVAHLAGGVRWDEAGGVCGSGGDIRTGLI